MVRYLAIHHTAVSRDRQSTQVYSVNRYHRNKFGVKARTGWYIGYNDFIDVSGMLYRIREWGNEETTAVIGHNCDVPSRCDTISVCLSGDFNHELPNRRQVATLRSYIRLVKRYYPGITVTFHRSLQARRTCPGALFTKGYLYTHILGIKPATTVDTDDLHKNSAVLAQYRTSDAFWALVERIKRLLLNRKIT